jgi:hypothetical protein
LTLEKADVLGTYWCDSGHKHHQTTERSPNKHQE